jgi:ABC-2 type transport system permease protein
MVVSSVVSRGSTAELIGSFRHPTYVTLVVLLPLVASVALQRYLFTPGSVSIMHSLPFTRGTLMLTNLVSGLLLVWTPLILSYLLAAVMIPGNAELSAKYTSGVTAEAYSILVSSYWASLGTTLMLSAMYLTLFNLAAMIVGNTALHVIVSGFLAFISFGLFALVLGLSSAMLRGYSTGDSTVEAMLRLLPMAYYPYYGEDAAASTAVQCIVGAIGMYAIAAVLYSRRNLEKAGDGIVYKFAEIIFVSLVTLGGMTLMGLLIGMVSGVRFPYNWGTFVGGVLAFAISKMMAQKTIRIFNKRALLHFAVSALASFIFFLVFEFDLTGYEQRVPAVNNVESVQLNPADLIFGNMADTILNYEIEFREQENIETVQRIHREIISQGESSPPDNYEWAYRNWYNVWLNYDLKAGGTMTRSWSTWFPDDSSITADILLLLNSAEFKEQNVIAAVTAVDKIANITIQGSRYTSHGSVSLNASEYASFVEAIDADYRDYVYTAQSIKAVEDRKYDAAHNEINEDALGYVQIQLQNPDIGYTMSYTAWDTAIMKSYSRTTEWLIAHGYYDILRSAVEYYRQ